MKIYVGNLKESTTRRDIRDMFAAFGAVSRVAIVSRARNGRLRRFGVVEMLEPEEGDLAISVLHGSSLNGRTLKVRKAPPRDSRDDN